MKLLSSNYFIFTFTLYIVHISSFLMSKNTYGQIISLGKYSIHSNAITLSGLSNGGGFAQQLQFSYSSLFKGIAVFQHAFYRCGPGDGIEVHYDDACTLLTKTPRESLYNPIDSIQYIQKYFNMGLIEDPNNLRNKKLYIYIGTYNYLHSPDISLKILEIYEPYIRNVDAIYTRVQTANLTLPTNRFGGTCQGISKENYYLSNCGLSGPFDALTFLLGHKYVKFPPPKEHDIPLQPLQLFDQTEFTKNIQGIHLMDTLGYLYVPKKCNLKKCFLHFYFHGCSSGREYVGKKHIQNSGFLEIAELNGIIMVFPQVVRNNAENHQGCWDTYGFSGKFFATQRGTQIQGVRNMIAKILGESK